MNRIRFNRQALTPQSPTVRASIRTSCAVVLAAWTAFFLHLPEAFWSVMTVIVISTVYVGYTVDKILMRLLGTIAGALMGYILARFVINNLFLYFLACGCGAGIGAYYFHVSRYPYAWIIFGVSLLVVMGSLPNHPTDIFYVAIWRTAEVCVGEFAVVATLCIFPNDLSKPILTAYRDIFTDFINIYEHLFNFSLRDEAWFYTAIAEVKKKHTAFMEYSVKIRRESALHTMNLEQLELVAQVLLEWMRELIIFASPAGHDPVETHESNASLDLQPALQQLFRLFKIISEAFPLIPESFDTQMTDLTQHIHDLKLRIPQENWPVSVHRLILLLQESVEFLNELKHVSLHQTRSLSQPLSQAPHTYAKKDKMLIGYGIKTGLSAALTLGIALIINWPNTVPGIVSSIIISIRGDLHEMKKGAIQRLYGCFLGGMVSLGLMHFIAFTRFDLIYFMGISVFCFSLLTYGSSRWSYIGLQASAALAMTLVQPEFPPISIALPLERIAGILMGIMGSFIIQGLFSQGDLMKLLELRVTEIEQKIEKNKRAVQSHPDSAVLNDFTDLFFRCRGWLSELNKQKHDPAATRKLNALSRRFEKSVLANAQTYHWLKLNKNQHSNLLLNLQATTSESGAWQALKVGKLSIDDYLILLSVREVRFIR